MTDMWIIFVYLSPILVVGTLYLMAEVSFWAFCMCFGIVDRHLQERHWRKIL